MKKTFTESSFDKNLDKLTENLKKLESKKALNAIDYQLFKLTAELFYDNCAFAKRTNKYNYADQDKIIAIENLIIVIKSKPSI